MVVGSPPRPMLMSAMGTKDARVALLDASPIAPEVEAIELVDRLAESVTLIVAFRSAKGIHSQRGLPAATKVLHLYNPRSQSRSVAPPPAVHSPLRRLE
jgi:hypothetical protein